MKQLLAILNVVAWGGFWAFGFLALSGAEYSSAQLTIAALLAGAGLLVGGFAFLKLIRISETTGYARPSRRSTAAERESAQARWGAPVTEET